MIYDLIQSGIGGAGAARSGCPRTGEGEAVK